MSYDDIDFEGGDRPPTLYELMQDIIPGARNVTITHQMGYMDNSHADETVEVCFTIDPEDISGRDLTHTSHDVIGMMGPGKLQISAMEYPSRQTEHYAGARFTMTARVFY